MYVTGNADTVCPDCANGDNGSGITDDEEAHPDERLSGWFIHYEGPPATCAHCNVDIHSSYGDPEAKEEA